MQLSGPDDVCRLRFNRVLLTSLASPSAHDLETPLRWTFCAVARSWERSTPWSTSYAHDGGKVGNWSSATGQRLIFSCPKTGPDNIEGDCCSEGI